MQFNDVIQIINIENLRIVLNNCQKFMHCYLEMSESPGS